MTDPLAADDIPPHQPRNRSSAESKLRRGKRHCPICLRPFGKNATRTKRMRSCVACRACPQAAKRCLRCGQLGGIWESPGAAGCQACGLHGPKPAVIAPSPPF